MEQEEKEGNIIDLSNSNEGINNSEKKSTIDLGDVDYPKVAYHPQRTKEWLEKGDCYPIYLEISPTDKCNHRCVFCALDYLKCGGNDIDSGVMIRALKEMAEKGVKSIMFAGEGEPLLHKDIGLFTQKATEFGLDVSITSNGVFFNKEKIEQCLPNLSWIKFSIDAGTPEDYAEVHGTRPEDFEKLMQNIMDAVEYKKQNNLLTTIGAQCLIIPRAINNIDKLAERLKEAGADYLILKPYSKHPSSVNEFVVDAEEYNLLEDKLKKYNSETFKILFRKAAIERLESKRGYSQCYGLPFITLIDSRGNIIPCNLFHNNPEFAYGNLNEQSFSEIWEGEKRKQLMEILRKKGVSDCRMGCRLDPSNRFLHRLKNPHGHDNFI